MYLIAALSKATAEAMLELAYISLALLGIFLLIWIIISIMKVRDIRTRDTMRRKQDAGRDIGERLDLVEVLPDLNREELKRMALEEKERKAGQVEKINLENYEGLPLKPTIYFDPEKDKASPDEKPPEPKIQRSILSNEPFPRDEVELDVQPDDIQIEEETDTEPSPWMPIGKPVGEKSPGNAPDTDDKRSDPQKKPGK